MDNFLFAVGYTMLLAIVSFHYYSYGRVKGIEETIVVFKEHEPQALDRISNTIRKILNVQTNT